MEIKVSERCHGTTLRRGANTRCKHVTNRSTLCHQHLKVDKSLRIKEPSQNKKEIQGRTKYGLFTTGFIPAGGRFCYWTGETLEQNPDSKFALQILRKPPTWVDASRSDTSEARYARTCMNPAKCENNAILKHSKKTNQTYLEALRDINPGEEILTQGTVSNLRRIASDASSGPVTPKKQKGVQNSKIASDLREGVANPIQPKPRRRIRIIVPDEDEAEEEPAEDASHAIRRRNDLPQGFNLHDEPNSPIARPPTPPRIQPSKKKKKPEDASRQEIRRRDHIKENKKREDAYELKILKRLLLIQTLFRDPKIAQKN